MFEPLEPIDEPLGWVTMLDAKEAGFCPDHRFDRTADTTAGQEADREQSAARDREWHRAIEEAFAAGHAEGLAQGLQSAEAERTAGQMLRLATERIDGQMQRELADRLALIVIELSSVTLAPMALDRQGLEQRCQAAAKLLADTQDRTVLRLHGDDIDRLDPEFAAAWRIVPDPELARGDIRVEGAEASIIDGPTVWRAALEAAIAS